MLRCTAQREVRRGGLVEDYYGGLAPQKFQRVLLAPPLVLGRLETSVLAAAWSDVLCCVYTRVAGDDESESWLTRTLVDDHHEHDPTSELHLTLHDPEHHARMFQLPSSDPLDGSFVQLAILVRARSPSIDAP